MIITEILARNARMYGNETALIERIPAENIRREITWKEFDDEANFQVICLMKTDKYNSMPQEDRTMVENLNNDNINIQDVMIKNPNNPIQLIDAKLLIFKV